MKINTDALENIFQQCGRAVVFCHLNPDGDSIGSSTAMHHYLKERGISSRIISPTEYPSYLKFLDPKGDESILIGTLDKEKAKAAIQEADLLILIDMNTPSRLADLEESVRKSPARKILIDHHPGPEENFFDLTFQTTKISSASELLFWILYNMPDIDNNVNRLSKKTANSLYSGMLTDTNNFSNSVFPSTFEMASLLIGRGVDKTRIQEIILNSYSISRMKLMGHMLSEEMCYVPSHHAAYMVLAEKTKAKYKFDKGDSEGFVNLPLQARKVKISALFTEDAQNNYIRVSLRSKGKIDVNGFARAFFNGGGHFNAAGGRLEIPVKEIPAYFEESLKKFFGA